jgi:site-specific recombinase XerD
MWKINSISE